jgi:hypothetical protein
MNSPATVPAKYFERAVIVFLLVYLGERSSILKIVTRWLY